ncbi:MAG TPA: ATP-binding protein [Tepidisphaeraceae bacterium]|nr:ATP-binding protein [Tepidisphaeraceae bacterium]
MEYPNLSLLSTDQEPRIVLGALTRLRWLAVVGQSVATIVAVAVLGLKLPLIPIAVVIALTAVSNLLLTAGYRLVRQSAWMIPAVLLLDVVLLTGLLALTGGPKNPFATLYLVHVAMAVIVLGSVWTWVVAGTIAVCYAAILRWHLPLDSQALRSWQWALGNWIALVLVSALIATFIGRVIHALRQHQLDLALARQRAARNEQLASLTTLAAGAAHELNTPLGTIAVVARELERSCEQGGLDGGREEAVEAGGGGAVGGILDDAQLIRREVDRCRMILDRMRLHIDADSAAAGSSTPLADLCQHLREQIDAPSRDRLVLDYPQELSAAPVPAPALEQALLVLLRNAFDASAPDQPVRLAVSRNNGHVRFEVQDRGCGMSPDLLRRAGEPFFTTKEPGKGMGLGLFLVRRVAEQVGGTFSLDSQEGAGTRCVLEVATEVPNHG